MTPLGIFFDRHTPIGGSPNTVNVSKWSIRLDRDNAVTTSGMAATYKMLVQLAKDEKDDLSFFSIDTGMSGNLFSGHMFDMNKDHVEGKLKPMRWSDRKLEGVKV